MTTSSQIKTIRDERRLQELLFLLPLLILLSIQTFNKGNKETLVYPNG